MYIIDLFKFPKIFCFSGIFFGKSLDGIDKSRTFAPAFAQKIRAMSIEKEFFERFT